MKPLIAWISSSKGVVLCISRVGWSLEVDKNNT